MFERRPILVLLIALTLCISVWRMSGLDSSLYAPEYGYGNQLSFDEHRPLPTASELKHTPPEPVETHPQQYRTNYGRTMPKRRTTPHSFDSEQHLALSNNLSLASFTPSWVTQSPPSLSSSYDYESLPADDFTTLIDLKDFRFLINQAPCRRRETAFFLILIHSAPVNYEKRQIIRETWGSVQSPNLRLLFLVGAVSSSQLQHKLEKENSQFADLVQGNFVDDYRNMTYKHVMALKWFIYFCPEAKYLIKTDDDVFVNTPQLLDYVELRHQLAALPLFTLRTSHTPSTSTSSNDNSFSRNTSHIAKVLRTRNFLFCQKQAGARVKRSYRSKWRVSSREFPGRYYPPYCPGYSIMYSPDVVFRLYREAQVAKYFWIDDVHITGTLAQRSNITITSFWPWRMSHDAYEDILSGKTDISHYMFLFAWANISDRQIRDLWGLTFSHFNSTRSNGGGASAYKYDSFR